MKFLLALTVLALASHMTHAAIDEEEHVLVLTTGNFDEAVKTHQYVLVEFYAPWCGHCKALAPEYAKAATTLHAEGSELRLAKVDATIQSELGERFKVKGYPTIKFFMNGEPIEYAGGRTADEIVAWLKKKSGPAAVTLTTVEDLTKLKADSEVAVVGLFKDLSGASATAFQNVAKLVDSASFAVSSESALFDELGVKGSEGLVLLKKFDEGRNDFDGKYDEEEIKKFIHSNQLALVSEFNQEVRF